MLSRFKIAALGLAVLTLSTAANAATVEFSTSGVVGGLPSGYGAAFTGVNNVGLNSPTAFTSFGNFVFTFPTPGASTPVNVPFTLTITQHTPSPNNGPQNLTSTLSGTLGFGLTFVTLSFGGVNTAFFTTPGPQLPDPVAYTVPDATFVSGGVASPLNAPLFGSVNFVEPTPVVPVPTAVLAGAAMLGGLGIKRLRSMI